MDPKEEKMALAPQPRRVQRFRAVRAEGPPERTKSREAERILSFVTVTGLAIIDVPYQFAAKISKGAGMSNQISEIIPNCPHHCPYRF
jgi:hypothetical protein